MVWNPSLFYLKIAFTIMFGPKKLRFLLRISLRITKQQNPLCIKPKRYCRWSRQGTCYRSAWRKRFTKQRVSLSGNIPACFLPFYAIGWVKNGLKKSWIIIEFKWWDWQPLTSGENVSLFRSFQLRKSPERLPPQRPS